MCYAFNMEVTITQFRRDLFDLVNDAMDGNDIWVSHKGRRFKVAPEGASASRLERITPLEITNSEYAEPELSLQQEMEAAWEKDWADL